MEREEKRIKVLFVISSLIIGGFETKIRTLLDGMDKSRFELVVLLVYPYYKMDEKFLAMRQKHLEYFDMEDVETIEWGMKRRFQLSIVGYIVRFIKSRKIDVLYFTAFGATTFFAPIAGRISGVQMIIKEVQNVLDGLYPPVLRGLDKRLTRICHQLIVPSRFLKNLLVEKLQCPEERIEVIPNAINLEKFGKDWDVQPLRDEFHLPEKVRCIGIIANLTPVKDHQVLLAAVPDVVAKCPDTCFLIVGEGPLRSSLESMTRDLGITDHVMFMGHRSDVDRIISLLDIGVSCSKVETLGISLIEMMASGVPIVAPPVGGIPEFLTDQETGLFVPQGDSKALAKALVRLLKDDALMKQYGKNARDMVFEKFSEKHMAATTEALIQW